MASYILKRILAMIPTLVGIVVVTFLVIHMAPGDPATLKSQAALQGITSEEAAGEVVSETRKYFGLDKPLHVQFFEWAKRAVTFDFGSSFKDDRQVTEKIMEALPVTILINALSILLIYIVAVPLGVVCAMKPGGVVDRLSAAVTLLLYSVPGFWIAVMLIATLTVGRPFNIFPIIGISSEGASALPWYSYVGNVIWHLALPVACLSVGGFAFLSRFIRASFIEVLRKDFILVARAKGLSTWRVVTGHALRNALIPLLTLMGSILPALLGGSVIVEQIFSIPGMGRLGFEAVLTRDYPLIMAITTLSAAVTLIGIFIADVMYAVADPRISYGKN